MRKLRWLAAVVLLLGSAVGVIAFVLGNAEPVRVALPFAAAFYRPLWLVIASSFLLGAFAASGGLLFQLGRKSLAARRSEKRAVRLESELAALRTAAPAIAVGDGAPPARPSP